MEFILLILGGISFIIGKVLNFVLLLKVQKFDDTFRTSSLAFIFVLFRCFNDERYKNRKLLFLSLIVVLINSVAVLFIVLSYKFRSILWI
jgi:hypothetical protein